MDTNEKEYHKQNGVDREAVKVEVMSKEDDSDSEESVDIGQESLIEESVEDDGNVEQGDVDITIPQTKRF